MNHPIVLWNGNAYVDPGEYSEDGSVRIRIDTKHIASVYLGRGDVIVKGSSRVVADGCVFSNGCLFIQNLEADVDGHTKRSTNITFECSYSAPDRSTPQQHSLTAETIHDFLENLIGGDFFVVESNPAPTHDEVILLRRDDIDAPSDDMQISDACRICMSNRKTCAFCPCGHRVLCGDCADKYIANMQSEGRELECVLCRGSALCIVRVYE